MTADTPPSVSAGSFDGVAPEYLLAALQIQQEWGVDVVMGDLPWQVMAEAPRKLRGHQQADQGPPQSRSQVDSAAAGPQAQRVPNANNARPALRQNSTVQPSVSADDILQSANMEELVERSSRIEGLLLARTAMHQLVPSLVKGASILVIGEVPDEEEDRTGQLFAGKSGSLLDQILASIGLSREKVSLAPAIPWRPPGGQRVPQQEMARCLPILQRTIILAAPQYIVTMGASAASMLIGGSFSRIRGQWQELTLPGGTTPLPLLPVVHPLQLSGPSRMVPGIRRTLWHDLLSLAEKAGL